MKNIFNSSYSFKYQTNQYEEHRVILYYVFVFIDWVIPTLQLQIYITTIMSQTRLPTFNAQ